MLYTTWHQYKLIKVKRSLTKDEYRIIDFSEIERNNAQKIQLYIKHCVYLEVFDPTDLENKKFVHSSLQDDLAEIYNDLIRLLIKVNGEYNYSIKEYALRNLKQSFYEHWGNHCIDALRALHYLNKNRLVR